LARAELNSLRERKLARKVNRVRLTPHITLPRVAPAFATAAGIFLATERAADFRATRSCIHVRDSAIAPDRADEFLRFADVICENRTGQTLGNAVLDCDRFIEIAIS